MQGKLIAGRYVLERLLGRGGMGEVWAARDRSLRRPVAIKLLHVGAALNRELVARFEREAIAAAQVNHPNVVALYDRGVHEDLLYIVMEKVEGASLAEVLGEQGPMPVDRALALASGICSALVAAHDAGVIHYDIKPQNVMVTPARQVKVVDFGIAGFALPTGSIVRSTLLSPAGTPEYGAPEQFSAQRGDERSDLYSLGCVLFAMLAGHPPLEGFNAYAVINRKATQEAPRLDSIRADVPPDLTALIAELLAREPARRPRTARDVEARLASARQMIAQYGSTVVETPTQVQTRLLPGGILPGPAASTSLPPSLGRTARSRAYLAWVVAGALALITASIGVVLAIQPDDHGSLLAGGLSSSSATLNTSTVPMISAASRSSSASRSSAPATNSGAASGQITVAYLGLCLDDRGDAATAGSAVEVNACSNIEEQRWTVASDGSIRTAGLCLDLTHGATANGTTVFLSTCDGSQSQQWKHGTGYTVVNAASGSCLSDTGFGWQTNLAGIWSCSGDESQKWHLPSDPGSGLSVTGGTAGHAIGYSDLCLNAQSTGAAGSYTVDMASCDDSSAQQWTVESDGTIRSLGLCLDVAGGGSADGTDVNLHACNGTTAQEWAQGQATTMYGYPASPGISLDDFKGVLVNPATGRCLSDTGFGGPGNQVTIWDCSGDSSQQWKLP